MSKPQKVSHSQIDRQAAQSKPTASCPSELPREAHNTPLDDSIRQLNGALFSLGCAKDTLHQRLKSSLPVHFTLPSQCPQIAGKCDDIETRSTLVIILTSMLYRVNEMKSDISAISESVDSYHAD